MANGKEPSFSFISNTVDSYRRCARFREEIEELLRKKAVSIENNLENSMATGNKLKINKLVFFTKRIDYEDPKPLIAESLLIYANRRNKDIRNLINNELEAVDSDSRKAEILQEVRSLLPRSVEKGYENLVADGAHGWYYSGSHTIVMKRVPSSFLKQLEIPPVLEPLCEFANYPDEQSINGTIVHELTHAWLNANSSSYSSEDVSGAINEIFSYYTSYVVHGGKFSNEGSDLYDRPELIKWGVQILVDKAEEFRKRGMSQTGIDFARSLELKIYEASTTGRKGDFKVLLRGCLLKQDKKRLQKFRDLNQKIERNLGGIKHLVFGDAQGALKDTEEGKQLRRLGEQITWEDTSRMEEKILENILNQAIGGENPEYGDLEWVNYKITEELEKRAEMLKKYLKGFEIAKKNLSSGEFQEHIVEAEKEILKLEKQLEHIIEEGKIDSATLKHAPAIVIDE
jgi:hypothetical protein